MEAVFLKLFNMSIAAGWMVLAVVLLRLVLKKAPRALFCLLWGLVAVRLVCPFSLESVLSLVPSAETLPKSILSSDAPRVNTGIAAINSAVNPIISTSLAPNPGDSVNPLQVITAVAAYVWIFGVAAMLVYSLVSYIRLRRTVSVSVNIEANVWICDDVKSPFILGIFKPRIYIPSDMNEESRNHVVSHENAHILRKDHLWKPIGFALLTIYWFNPLVWIAYILLCRDIESACDEKVVRDMDAEAKKGYSEALLVCSSKRRLVSACPLAFGEVGVKQRIKGVLNYKKPAFWVIIIAIVASIVLAVAFLTDPIRDDYAIATNAYTDCPWVDIEVKKLELEGDKPYVRIKWKNNSGRELLRSSDVMLYHHEGTAKINCSKYPIDTVEVYMPLGLGETTSSHGLSKNIYDFSVNGEYTLEYKLKFNNSDEIYTATVCFEVFGSDLGNILMITDQLEFNSEIFTVRSIGEYFTENADNTFYEDRGSRVPLHRIENKSELDTMLSEHIEGAGALVNFADKLDDAWFEENCLFLLGIEDANGTGEQYVNHIAKYGNSVVFSLCEDMENNAAEFKVNKVITVIVEKKDLEADSYFNAYIMRINESTEGVDTSSGYKVTFAAAGAYETPYNIPPCDNAADLYVSAIKHLPVNRIESAKELEWFMSIFPTDALYKDIDGNTPFGVIAHRDYDERFFAEKDLFLVYFYPSDNNYGYNVSQITVNAKWVGIEVAQNTLPEPESISDEMFCWIAAIEVPRADVATAEKISAWMK